MYEKIALIGELRAGGKWIKSIFDPDHYMDLREFYSVLPQNGIIPTVDGHKARSHVHAGHKLVDVLVPILLHSNIHSDIISAIHDSLVSLEISDNGTINSKFSNLEICLLIQETYKKLNKGSIIKILPSTIYLDTTNKIKNSLANYDLCIRFYRKNILNTYISHMKAIQSGCWSKTESDKKNIVKDNIKIFWDYKHYNKYYENMLFSYNYLLNNLESRNSIMVAYEDIHEKYSSNLEKLNAIINLIKPICSNILIMDNPVLDGEKRESADNGSIESNFINSQQFLIDLNSGLKINLI
jgi:hypothetical protein